MAYGSGKYTIDEDTVPSTSRSRTEEKLERRKEWRRHQELEQEHERLRKQKIEEWERKRAQELGKRSPSDSPPPRHTGRSGRSPDQYLSTFKKNLNKLSGPWFKDPEGRLINSTELRRIKVDIRRNIPVKGPIPEIKRDIHIDVEDKRRTKRSRSKELKRNSHCRCGGCEKSYKHSRKSKDTERNRDKYRNKNRDQDTDEDEDRDSDKYITWKDIKNCNKITEAVFSKFFQSLLWSRATPNNRAQQAAQQSPSPGVSSVEAHPDRLLATSKGSTTVTACLYQGSTPDITCRHQGSTTNANFPPPIPIIGPMFLPRGLRPIARVRRYPYPYPVGPIRPRCPNPTRYRYGAPNRM
ncbi:U1 small nuclear ribonucleoprotein 70 kDa-like [Pseudomyrmex gracilis]|uniref:U1 small nuclear ribonucleoprotein 70 kDa-like n=1 Tax=Pseudomyrmex gracilis TaxID=219809 RepID=UPI0009949B32|nr:U1 small nuclear ribonucleoprotein 70 kDa-like [Pseudomyrmex gracilis]